MTIDRRKALRIRTEGELAQDQLSEMSRTYLAEKFSAAAKANEVHRHIGYVMPLRDVLRWTDETLRDRGLRREDVARAIEAAEDLEHAKRQMEARRAALEPKAQIAARMNLWLREKGIDL